jgi:lipopolysaccharide transport system permease protein
MAEVAAEPHEVVIEPDERWLRLPWRELWEYRDLLVLLVQRDFIARYKQTLLGPAWFIVQPVLTTIVFAIVFGRIAGIPTDGIPSPLFYMCGLLGWNYFAQTITSGGGTFVNNAHLFTKVYFPRLVVPLSVTIANLFTLALQFIPFAAFFIYYKFIRPEFSGVQPDWRVLLLPLPVLHLALLALGVSLWMSASTAKYRDLVHLNQFLVQLWMFATPVIYPLSQVSEKWAWLIWANPASVPVEAFRICLLGRGTLLPMAVALSAGMTLVLLTTSVIAFRRVEGTVADSV